MPDQIYDVGTGNLLDQLGNARPDAGQRARRRKQWKENSGTQGFRFLVEGLVDYYGRAMQRQFTKRMTRDIPVPFKSGQRL